MRAVEFRQLIKEIRMDKAFTTFHLSNYQFYKYFYLIGKVFAQMLVEGYQISLPRIGVFGIVTRHQLYKFNHLNRPARAAIDTTLTRQYNQPVYSISDDNSYNKLHWWKNGIKNRNIKLYNIRTLSGLKTLIHKASVPGVRYTSIVKVTDYKKRK